MTFLGGLSFDFSSGSLFGDFFHRRHSGPVRGANMEVELSIAVPPGTQPQAVLGLKKKGLPAYGGESRGDLYWSIAVQIPERLRW